MLGLTPLQTPPKYQNYTLYSSAILASFSFFICWINISLRPDEVASVWRSAKVCHDLINDFTLF